MKRDLLIHSMSTFAPITIPVLQAINATVIAEIGAEHGGNSKLLYEWLKNRSGKLISIDCNPSKAFLDWLPTVNDVVHHVAKESLQAIPDIQNVDAWFIDGDHNWYTVYHELKMIRDLNKKQNRPTLIFLHDVSWPWARRDLYYSPNRIPEKYRHPHTFDGGVTLDNADIIKGGFRSNGAYAIAKQEGGEKNGVLTAVDDFTKEFKGEYCFAHIPAVFGLGVLFDLTHPDVEKIAALVTPYHNNHLLQTLETNRLDNYLKVIEMQDRDNEKVDVRNSVKENTRATTVGDWEAQAVELITMLNDQGNQPDIWKKLQSRLPNTRDALKQFSNYLGMLLAVPQDQLTLKLINILEAICHAKCGDLKSAHARLEKLYAIYPDCPLIVGAYSQTLNVATE